MRDVEGFNNMKTRFLKPELRSGRRYPAGLFKGALIALLAAFVAGCGGGLGEDDSHSSTSAVSPPSSSAVSSPSVSSSVSNPSVSSSSARASDESSSRPSSAPGDERFIGDAGQGQVLYGEHACANCHGPNGKGSLQDIDVSKFAFGTRELEQLIAATMPTPGTCVGQCAADIAAYLYTWPVSTPAQACENNMTYGARQLKLLTREEYQNSLEDLVGIDFNVGATIPADADIHGYANNVAAAVTQIHQEAYFEAARQVAAWARERDFAGIVDCGFNNAQSCIDDFTQNFAKRAFRRPLTRGEVTAFTALFGESFTGGDVAAGVEIAINAALVSAAFLYRSEQGVPVSMGEYDGGQYEFSGTPSTLLATDFTDKRHYSAGTLEGAAIVGDTTNSRQQGKLGQHIRFEGDGTLIEFSVRGVLPEDGTIPVLKFGVGAVSGSITIDWEEFRTLSLYLPGVSGHREFAFYLDPSSAQVELHRMQYGEAQRVENAPDEDAYELTQYEVATYLAYTFTGSTPDVILMEAADAGQLATDQQVAAQVERLLETPKAAKRLGNFAAQWMGTDLALTQPKDITLFPEINDEIRQSMAQEVRELFVHATLSGNSFAEFFASDYAFIDGTLGQFYGLSGGSDSSFGPTYGGGERGGILTTGAFHVAYGNFEETSPIVRAARVREKLLCQDIPPPPAGIAIDRAAAEERIADIIADGGSVTQRERTAMLTEEPYCAQCHEKIINPLGFGMEDFDSIGRYQLLDINHNAVDASGMLHGLESLADIDSTGMGFTGSKDLGEVLASTDSAYACFVENAFRFATGTGTTKIDKNNPDMGSLSAQEIQDFTCSVQGMTENMIQSGYDAREVFKSLGTMKLIRYRKEMNR